MLPGAFVLAGRSKWSILGMKYLAFLTNKLFPAQG